MSSASPFIPDLVESNLERCRSLFADETMSPGRCLPLPPQLGAKRAQQVARTLAALGHKVAPQIIIQRISVPDAIGDGKSANEDEPNGRAAEEFKSLFDWL